MQKGAGKSKQKKAIRARKASKSRPFASQVCRAATKQHQKTTFCAVQLRSVACCAVTTLALGDATALPPSFPFRSETFRSAPKHVDFAPKRLLLKPGTPPAKRRCFPSDFAAPRSSDSGPNRRRSARQGMFAGRRRPFPDSAVQDSGLGKRRSGER